MQRAVTLSKAGCSSSSRTMTTAATAPASAPAARATAAALPRRRQQQHHHRRHCRAFGVAVCASSSDAPLLEVKGLEAVIAATGQQILKGVNLTLRAGETHAIMGTNGSGKSTLSKVLVGHPDYEVTAGSVLFKGEDLLSLEPEERAQRGVFLSFQSPVEVPGVSNTDFLRLACNARRKARGEPELDPLEFFGHLTPKLEKLGMDPSFLSRDVNAGFSGGEKKRNEILQMAVMEPEVGILDEVDSGLDIDALRDVASAVSSLRSSQNATLMVTHYKRLLDLVVPEKVHVMQGGKIIYSGGMEVADTLEASGYEGVKKLMAAAA